jgi:hypothetical protein
MDPIILITLAVLAIVLVGLVRNFRSLFFRVREAVEAFRNVGKPPDGPVDEPFDPDRRV